MSDCCSCSCKGESREKKPEDAKTAAPVYSMSAGAASSTVIH